MDCEHIVTGLHPPNDRQPVTAQQILHAKSGLICPRETGTVLSATPHPLPHHAGQTPSLRSTPPLRSTPSLTARLRWRVSTYRVYHIQWRRYWWRYWRYWRYWSAVSWWGSTYCPTDSCWSLLSVYRTTDRFTGLPPQSRLNGALQGTSHQLTYGLGDSR